jgi:hypothetical protein
MYLLILALSQLSGVGINSFGGPMLIFVIFMLVLIINFDRKFNDPPAIIMYINPRLVFGDIVGLIS